MKSQWFFYKIHNCLVGLALLFFSLAAQAGGWAAVSQPVLNFLSDRAADFSEGSAKLWGEKSCSNDQRMRSLATLQHFRRCSISSSGDTDANWLAVLDASDEANQIAENKFYASLALQHSAELTCSAQFAKSMTLENTENKEARELIAAKIKMLREAQQQMQKAIAELEKTDTSVGKVCLPGDDLKPNPNTLVNSTHDLHYELCQKIFANRIASAALFDSIPFSETQEVKDFLEKYAKSKEIPAEGLEAGLKKAYTDAAKTLENGAKELSEQGQGTGEDIDRPTRYALFSDPRVVEKVIKDQKKKGNQKIEEVACRADQRSHSGADRLSQTVTISSLAVMALGRVYAVGNKFFEMAETGLGVSKSAGLVSINLTREVALITGTVAGGKLTYKAMGAINQYCLSRFPATLAKGTNEVGKCVAAPTLTQLKRDNCLLTLTFQAAGFATQFGPGILHDLGITTPSL